MEIKEIYDQHTFTVEFLVGRPIRRSHIIKLNGLVIGVGEAVKHEKETHNPYYGRLKAAKKAFEKLSVKYGVKCVKDYGNKY